MKKASYMNRKMTNLEKNTATNYYGLFLTFIKKKKLDMEEWCDRLHLPYVYAIMKYTDYERLHCYPIEVIILKSLEWAWRAELRKEFQLNRKPPEGFVSYNQIENYTFGGLMSISYGGVEKSAISNVMLEKITEKLKTTQRKQLLLMLFEGYKKIEIQEGMNINYRYLCKEIQMIRVLINELYRGEYL